MEKNALYEIKAIIYQKMEYVHLLIFTKRSILFQVSVKLVNLDFIYQGMKIHAHLKSIVLKEKNILEYVIYVKIIII
jgi:hypothetical protein